MKMIDLHCDTAMRLVANREIGLLKENDFHVDIKKLKNSGSLIQFFAYFIHMEGLKKYGHDFKNEMEAVMFYHERMMEEINHSDDIYLLKSYNKIDDSRIGALLTLEGAGAIQTIEDVYTLYDIGIRLITLTWNWVNKIGYPNVPEENMDKGLTPFGIEVIKKMNRLGMIVDVSHLSDAGFWDVIKHSTKPIVASHSNARVYGPHVRNLTDDMIKAVAKNGGIIGLNFCAAFLTEDTDAKKMYVKDLVKHTLHIIEVGGIDCMALGTDFDGIGGELEIADIGEMHLLLDALKEAGVSRKDLEKIWYKNALRVMKEVL